MSVVAASQTVAKVHLPHQKKMIDRKRRRRYSRESTSRMTRLLPSHKLICKVIVDSKLEARGREMERARLKQARASRSKRRS